MNARGRPKGVRKTGGRQKGTPNVVTASIKAAFTEAFDGVGGVPALVKWGKANPTPFYQCWSRLAPRDAPAETESGPVTIRVVRTYRDARTAELGQAGLALPRIASGDLGLVAVAQVPSARHGETDHE